jgi:hypothetical protein
MHDYILGLLKEWIIFLVSSSVEQEQAFAMRLSEAWKLKICKTVKLLMDAQCSILLGTYTYVFC